MRHEIWHLVVTLFAWPNGIVLGNLLASAIWAVPAILHLDRLMRRHHREHMAALKDRGQDDATVTPS